MNRGRSALRRAFVHATCVVLGWFLVPSLLSAQDGRWSVAPRVGYAWPGDLFRHEYTHYVQTPVSESNSGYLERLRIAAMRTLGARIGYRFAAGWTLGVEFERGASTFEDRKESSVNGTPRMGERRWSDAAMTSLGLVVGRELPLVAGASVDVGVGTWFHDFALDKAENPCPPSSGFAEICGVTGPWERRYSIPSLGGRIEIDRPITKRFGVEVGATYSTGRADTSNFWEDLVPEADAYEAPKTYPVRKLQVFAGAIIQL